MIYPAKLIVADLDGTLLRTDKTISEHTKAVLSQCHRSGVMVVYATGRGGTAERVAPAALFNGKITMNGAIAKIGDTICYSRLIPAIAARPILVACDKRGMRITSEISDRHYSNFNVSDIWPNITNYQIADFLTHDMDAEKIYTPNPMPDDIAFIKRLLPEDMYFIMTADGDGYLGQIMHKDATKAKAVSALAQHWGISLSDIIAFGDDWNDIDMLSSAGIGVAMGNALDEVKVCANDVCLSNDEDGLAKWIASYFGF